MGATGDNEQIDPQGQKLLGEKKKKP